MKPWDPGPLDRACDFASAAANAFSVTRLLALDLNVGRGIIAEIDSVCALIGQLDAACEMSRHAPVRHLKSAQDLAAQLYRNITGIYLRPEVAGDFASHLSGALNLARELEANLDRASLESLASDQGNLEHEIRKIEVPAARLLAIVTQLLPAADRDRYDEEFRSELWDLAQAGAGRFRQVAYALRQLRCARLTVSALRSPRRRGAVP